MKCLKAPKPPILPQQTPPSQWPLSSLIRPFRKAQVSQSLADSLYYAERPRGLGRTGDRLQAHFRRSSDEVTGRKPLPNPAIHRVEKPSCKRLIPPTPPQDPITPSKPQTAKSMKTISTPSQSTHSTLSTSRSSLYSRRNTSSVFASAPVSRNSSKGLSLSQTAALIQYQYAPKYREQKVTGKPQNVPLEDWGFWH
jgi:hypothetical protein